MRQAFPSRWTESNHQMRMLLDSFDFWCLCISFYDLSDWYRRWTFPHQNFLYMCSIFCAVVHESKKGWHANRNITPKIGRYILDGFIFMGNNFRGLSKKLHIRGQSWNAILMAIALSFIIHTEHRFFEVTSFRGLDLLRKLVPNEMKPSTVLNRPQSSFFFIMHMRLRIFNAHDMLPVLKLPYHSCFRTFYTPLKKEGHIALHILVGRSVCRYPLIPSVFFFYSSRDYKEFLDLISLYNCSIFGKICKC